MKKLISLLVLATMLCTLLTSCDDSCAYCDKEGKHKIDDKMYCNEHYIEAALGW